MDNTFHKRLYELRTKKNMTQDELASKVGVSRQAISKWERGEGLPDLYNVSLLAKALDVSVDDLLNDNPKEEPIHEDNSFSKSEAGNYLKRLLYKAKHTTNSEQAKKIKKSLLLVGGLGVLLGGLMVVGGFIGFASGAMNSVGNFEPFNPLPFMLMFLLGGTVSGISLYVLLGGLSIVVAGVTTKYLDTRKTCPTCGNEIDSDELICSNCGSNLKDHHEKTCTCGKVNQPEDLYCRQCGNKLS